MNHRLMKNSVIAVESAVIYGSIADAFGSKVQVTLASVLLGVVAMMILHEIDKAHAEKVKENKRIMRELREQEEKIGA